MKFEQKSPPRAFEVGWADKKLKIYDCGRVALEPNEQVTFITEGGAEYDLARKDWGFYATPSLNGRLPRFNLRAALVRNRIDQFFVLLVERGKEALFDQYVASEQLVITAWLDDTQGLKRLEGAVTTAATPTTVCPLCAGTSFKTTFHYGEPPAGERAHGDEAHVALGIDGERAEQDRFVRRLGGSGGRLGGVGGGRERGGEPSTECGEGVTGFHG